MYKTCQLFQIPTRPSLPHSFHYPITTSSSTASVAAMHRFRRLLFDTCRSTDDALIPPPASRNEPLVSFSGCNFRRPSAPHRNHAVAVDFAADDLSVARETPAYLWRKEEKWHVLSYDTTLPRSKIDSHEDVLLSRKSAARRKSKVSDGDGGGSGWFSSEEEEEAVLMGSSSESREWGFDAGGKGMRDSMAVVKSSEDPRRDFRRSMVEMVVEKGMYDAEDLEDLLRCFLSLNSKDHHVAIVAAFADVWEALFPKNSSAPPARRPG